MSIFELGLQNFNAIHVYAHVLKVHKHRVSVLIILFFVVECAQTRGVIISRNKTMTISLFS